MLKLEFKYTKDTKTCCVFQTGERPEFVTLYLKKSQIEDAGINPKKGITVTVEERKDS
jgi:hypothetical protein